tara:strand:- start:400 stop:861 length:462 start_codon:yes stop_codon:yes gene_type:complete
VTAGRTTLSFLDLALMLLSAFAYMHFVSIADSRSQKKMAGAIKSPGPDLGTYTYKTSDFFEDGNAMLTDFARAEISQILTVQQKQTLLVSVAAAPEGEIGSRLRQWEMISARSAAIADAFEKAGQDGKMIVLKVPGRMVSIPGKEQKISLVFR